MTQAVGLVPFNRYHMMLNNNLRNPAEKCKVFFAAGTKKSPFQATRILSAGERIGRRSHMICSALRDSPSGRPRRAEGNREPGLLLIPVLRLARLFGKLVSGYQDGIG